MNLPLWCYSFVYCNLSSVTEEGNCKQLYTVPVVSNPHIFRATRVTCFVVRWGIKPQTTHLRSEHFVDKYVSDLDCGAAEFNGVQNEQSSFQVSQHCFGSLLRNKQENFTRLTYPSIRVIDTHNICSTSKGKCMATISVTRAHIQQWQYPWLNLTTATSTTDLFQYRYRVRRNLLIKCHNPWQLLSSHSKDASCHEWTALLQWDSTRMMSP